MVSFIHLSHSCNYLEVDCLVNSKVKTAILNRKASIIKIK